MNAVEIFVRDPVTAAAERIARLEVAAGGGTARITELRPDWAEAIDRMFAEGIPADAGGRLYLDDGEAFLAALPSVYRGSRFWAATADEPGRDQPGGRK